MYSNIIKSRLGNPGGVNSRYKETARVGLAFKMELKFTALYDIIAILVTSCGYKLRLGLELGLVKK